MIVKIDEKKLDGRNETWAWVELESLPPVGSILTLSKDKVVLKVVQYVVDVQRKPPLVTAQCERPSQMLGDPRDKLIEDLWWFMENVNEDTKDRTERFFALRERVREQNN